MPGAAAALFAATLLAYAWVVWRGGFIWDDDVQVLNNVHLRTWGGLWRIWTRVGPGAGGTAQYYPLTFSALWAEFQLWGLRPAGYHLVNVLLHALNATLLFSLLKRLAVPGAFWAAALFALHPVHVESVAWVIELKNTLSAALALGALHLLLGEAYVAANLLFALALASKTSCVVLPAVVVVLDWWKTGSLDGRKLKALSPTFALAALAGVVTTYVETGSVGANGPEFALALKERVFLAGRAAWFYAGKLAWPASLSLVYPRWEMAGAPWAQAVYPAAWLALLAGLWRGREKLGRAPLAVALLFLGLLAPVLGLINIFFMRYSYVADHFQYLASMPVLAAFAAFLSRAPRPLWAAILLALGAATVRRGFVYENVETIWRDTLAKNPACWLANNNLGVIEAARGNYDQALTLYAAALRAPGDHAETLNNAGLALAAAGRFSEAVARYGEALALKPELAHAYHNRGVALTALGKSDEAAADYLQALRYNPGLAHAHSNLGALLAVSGRYDEAIREYEEALRLDANLPEAHHNLGLALVRRGALDAAVEHFQEALRLKPDFEAARLSLFLALGQRGRPALPRPEKTSRP